MKQFLVQMQTKLLLETYKQLEIIEFIKMHLGMEDVYE